MIECDINTQAFFALVRAGLWEKDVQLLPYKSIDYSVIYTIAKEQSIVGLVAAGLGHVTDKKVLKQEVVQFIGDVYQVERRNREMNSFIGETVEKMQNAGIVSMLVKGQGIAQCYERPLWRASGDVDFVFDDVNYEKAKLFLCHFASTVDKEYTYFKHLGLTIGPWKLELHGTLRSRLSGLMDRKLDRLLKDTITGREMRTWCCDGIDVYLPAPNSNVIFVFTHILQHFYLEGIGLRQICDWCRLLWTYRDEINDSLLQLRLREMSIFTEWKAFSAYAVEYLGMPTDAMPLYSSSNKWKRKAKRINSFILEVGNFGYKKKGFISSSESYIVRKISSFGRSLRNVLCQLEIFPLGSIRTCGGVIISGLHSLINGE